MRDDFKESSPSRGSLVGEMTDTMVRFTNISFELDGLTRRKVCISFFFSYMVALMDKLHSV